MLEAEFDRIAEEYETAHARSIRISGERPDFFARYKIEHVANSWARRHHVSPAAILDFGAGVGNSLPHMRSAFPASEIVLLDPSSKSLAIAEKRFPGVAKFITFDGGEIPFEDGTFDLAFAACVFHHIPEDLHVTLLREIHRVLRPSGAFFLFEHNPWNPLTLHAVKNCSFDKNAILIDAPTMRSRLEGSGISNISIQFKLFFPRFLSAFRPIEKHLGWLPLGAQYVIQATR